MKKSTTLLIHLAILFILIIFISCNTKNKRHNKSTLPRIAIAGLAIESSTFSPALTHKEAFHAKRNEEVFKGEAGLFWPAIPLLPLLGQDRVHNSRPGKQQHIGVPRGIRNIRYIYPEQCNKIHRKQGHAADLHPLYFHLPIHKYR